MSQNLLIAKCFSVEIMMIHLSRIPISLSGNFDILNSTSNGGIVLFGIKTPYIRYELLEFGVPLNLRVYNSVPFLEVMVGYFSFTAEVIVSTV